MALARGRGWFVAWPAVVLIATGCGSGNDPEKAIVSGTVSYQGVPVKEGQIRFTPIGATKGPASVAFIEEGEYRITGRGGVQVGTHRVQIESYRPIPGAKPYTEEQADGHPEIQVGDIPEEQYIPAQYNKRSTLEVTIESGGGEITKDFDLT